MKNKNLLIIIVAMILIISSITHSAVVSDNDGSAFITKAEYDSLKNTFQSQLDKYNTSIDAKIDNAISAYISGLTIKKEVDETFIGGGHGTREFVNTFSLSNTNRLGDYVEGYSAVDLEFSNSDATYRSNPSGTYFNMDYVTFDTGYAAEPHKVSNGTNKDMFLYIQDSVWNSACKVSDRQIECIPFTSWFGYAVHHGSPPINNSFTKPANFTIESSSTNWGYQSGSFSLTAGGITMSCSPNAIFVSNDTIKTENVLECLAGSAVPTSKVYTLHLDDRSKLGPVSTYVPINRGYARIRYNGTSSQDGANSWMYGSQYRLTTYHHKYEHNYALSDLVVDTMSVAVDSAVRYYSGLPLFKASQDGKVTMKIKIANGGNETSKVAVRSGQFSNTAFSAGIYLDSTTADWKVDDVKSWPTNFNSNQEYKLEFDVKKGNYYYVKVLPNSTNHNSVFNIVGDIKNVSQD